MKLIALLDKKCILANLKATSKRGVLEELAAPLAAGPEGLKLETVVEVLMDRERLGSTGIGDNIAIPHGKLERLSNLKLAFGRSLKGVEFDAMDGKPSHHFFLLLAPINSRPPLKGPGQDLQDAHEPAVSRESHAGRFRGRNLHPAVRERRGILIVPPLD